jgi:hypothetical protein
MILRTLHSNTEISKKIIRWLLPTCLRETDVLAPALSQCDSYRPEGYEQKRIEDLKLITGKYMEMQASE